MGFYDDQEQILLSLSNEIHTHVVKVRQVILEAKSTLDSDSTPPTPLCRNSLNQYRGPLPLSPASAQRWVTEGTRPAFPSGKLLGPSVSQRPTRRVPLGSVQIPRFPGFGAFVVDDDDAESTPGAYEVETDEAVASSEPR